MRMAAACFGLALLFVQRVPVLATDGGQCTNTLDIDGVSIPQGGHGSFTVVLYPMAEEMISDVFMEIDFNPVRIPLATREDGSLDCEVHPEIAEGSVMFEVTPLRDWQRCEEPCERRLLAVNLELVEGFWENRSCAGTPGVPLFSCRVAVPEDTPPESYHLRWLSWGGSWTSLSDGFVSVVAARADVQIDRVRMAAGTSNVLPVRLADVGRSSKFIVSEVEVELGFPMDGPSFFDSAPPGTPDCHLNYALHGLGDEFSFRGENVNARIPFVDEIPYGQAPEFGDGVRELFSCRVSVPSTTPPGTYRILNTIADGYDRNGPQLDIRRRDTSLTVVACEPYCHGDCSGDCSVSTDELVRGVAMALGRARPMECMDRDLSGRVDVSELVESVGNALRGCAHR